MSCKRVVVITGGASGIGKATALKFASKKDRVVVADVNEDGGKKTVEQIKVSGGEAIFVKTDVTMYDDVEALVEKTVDTFGSIHVMFNNAGIARPAPLLDKDLEHYHTVINVNQHGVAYGIIAAGRKMKELGINGVIINTSSVYGFFTSRGTFSYHATKAAVIMMTKSAALELADYGIRVVAIAPGGVNTPIFQSSINSGVINENTLTNPEKIADIVYLISLEEASVINGSVIMADDGFSAFK